MGLRFPHIRQLTPHNRRDALLRHLRDVHQIAGHPSEPHRPRGIDRISVDAWQRRASRAFHSPRHPSIRLGSALAPSGWQDQAPRSSPPLGRDGCLEGGRAMARSGDAAPAIKPNAIDVLIIVAKPEVSATTSSMFCGAASCPFDRCTVPYGTQQLFLALSYFQTETIPTVPATGQPRSASARSASPHPRGSVDCRHAPAPAHGSSDGRSRFLKCARARRRRLSCAAAAAHGDGRPHKAGSRRPLPSPARGRR